MDTHEMSPLDQVICGESLAVLRELPDCSLDCCITDPPYGLGEVKDLPGLLQAWMQDADESPYVGKGGFMGQSWDRVCPPPKLFREIYRVLKPGAHLLCFAGTKTWDLMSLSIRLAGFEDRDTIAHLAGQRQPGAHGSMDLPSALLWAYGQGFPKSTSIEKQIDRMRHDEIRHVCRFLETHMGQYRITDIVKAMGFAGHGDHGVSAWFRHDHVSPRVPTWEQWLQLKSLLGFGDEMDAEVWRLNGRKGKPGDAWYEREVVSERSRHGKPPQYMWGGTDGQKWNETSPATDLARQWAGWGTNLKPSFEPVLVFRKPLDGTLAENVLKWGTGGLNIDQCRINPGEHVPGGGSSWGKSSGTNNGWKRPAHEHYHNGQPHSQGRWPSNLLLSHDPRCIVKGTKRVRGDGHKTQHPIEREVSLFGNGRSGSRGVRYNASDGMEIVQDWECVEGCPVRILGEQSGERKDTAHVRGRAGTAKFNGKYNQGELYANQHDQFGGYTDQGTAARYFQQFHDPLDTLDAPFLYCSKSSRKERDAGLEDLPTSQGFDKNTSKQIAHVNHETGETTYSEYQPSQRHNDSKERTFGVGKGTVRRCPLHDAPYPTASNSYTCGCPIQYEQPQRLYKLRDDLTPEQRAYVEAELAKIGGAS